MARQPFKPRTVCALFISFGAEFRSALRPGEVRSLPWQFASDEAMSARLEAIPHLEANSARVINDISVPGLAGPMGIRATN